ncbi:MAG: hypothetical protein NE327_04430 [Lentisphaeraceae bacterium]|nr:hypothetical protein [Lentisphaeraceae bacterium]
MSRLIKHKKVHYPVSDQLSKYLKKFGRTANLPLDYEDLLSFNETMAVYDKDDNPTLWETVIYPSSILDDLEKKLTKIYSQLIADGDTSIIEHLSVDRVDYCTYANSKPFRIRIINSFNDNYDHFYIKKADSSRIYGLELEGLLSPNRINYLHHSTTLIEEHIIGIPGDQFIETKMKEKSINKVRLAKEFVKFNERCFVSLLGDMRSYNYVVNVTPDVEEEQYRVRPIDFDQQSFEGDIKVYLPQFFEENNEIVQLCMDLLNPKTVKQYQNEERSLIGKRFRYSHEQIMRLLKCMVSDTVSTEENTKKLKKALADFHKNKKFLECTKMGEVVLENILTLVGKQTNR